MATSHAVWSFTSSLEKRRNLTILGGSYVYIHEKKFHGKNCMFEVLLEVLLFWKNAICLENIAFSKFRKRRDLGETTKTPWKNSMFEVLATRRPLLSNAICQENIAFANFWTKRGLGKITEIPAKFCISEFVFEKAWPLVEIACSKFWKRQRILENAICLENLAFSKFSILQIQCCVEETIEIAALFKTCQPAKTSEHEKNKKRAKKIRNNHENDEKRTKNTKTTRRKQPKEN